MSNNKVLFSGFKWDHHNDESGYHHVVASAVDYVDGGLLFGGKSTVGSLKKRFNFLLIDLMTIFKAFRYDAVLLFYPEQTSYISAPLLRLMGKKVVYVVHLGGDYWFHRDDSLFLKLKRFNLRFVSKFITLTDQQKEVFEQYFPGKVAKIPHGAWCKTSGDLSRPMQGDVHHITVVGDTYRDYGLLGRIITTFRDKYPKIVFDLVGMKYEKLNGIQDSSNVVCHGRLDKENYNNLINNALFMMLPLEFATANNALLEALSLGVPVICSKVHGVREYLPQGDYVFDSIEDLGMKLERRLTLTGSERNAETEMLASYVRENYSWGVIRNQVIAYCVS